MLTKIKICGIKTVEEIEIINQYPIDYIGFIFAKSKRQVEASQVIALKKALTKEIGTVGVFVNEELETVNDIIAQCNLQVVQLHGNESVDYCNNVAGAVWKTISIGEDTMEEVLKAIEKYNGYVDGILLDTVHKGQAGGTGQTFDWQYMANALEGIDLKSKLIIAGGLSHENICEAIDTFKPYAVDLNSKLETDLIKDEEKVKKVFLELQRKYR